MSGPPTIDGAVAGVIAAKQAAVRNEIGFAVAAKGLEAIEAQGRAAVELLATAANLGKAVGLGSKYDSQA